AWRGYFSSHYIEQRWCIRRKVTKCFLSGFAQSCRSSGHSFFIQPSLRIIATGHACVEVNFLIAGQHTRADEAMRFIHRKGRRFTSPRKWTEMIAAQQDSMLRKPSVAGRSMNKRGKLFGHLPRVAAKLVYLAGG